MVFDMVKYHIFSYIITRYAFVWSLSKKFVNGCRISIFSVSPKKAKMCNFGEKVAYCTYHRYLLNESGDPNLFSFLLCVYHEIQTWKVLGNFHF